MPRARLPLAVTGGIAEGKSTVVGFLSAFGLLTWSADDCVRELLRRQPEIALQMRRLCGLADDSPNREVLGVIGQDADARRAVNALLHPHVVEAMFRSEAQVFEVPLLIETGLHRFFEEVWVVYSGREKQIERLRKRYGEGFDGAAAIAVQLPTRSKLAFADEIVRTNGRVEAVREEVRTAFQRRPGLQVRLQSET